MIIRQIGFGILAALAIAVTFGLQPEEPEPISTAHFDRQIQQALADFEANESRSSGAPQQQVVNGWVNRDLLTIISRQLSASIQQPPVSDSDPRIAHLLLLLVLAVGWHGATSTTANTQAVPVEPEPLEPALATPAIPEPDTDSQPRVDGP